VTLDSLESWVQGELGSSNSGAVSVCSEGLDLPAFFHKVAQAVHKGAWGVLEVLDAKNGVNWGCWGGKLVSAG
jgi:hypothetical protein